MNDLQRKYHAGEIGPEEYIQALERRLAEAELNIQALARAQFDAVMESGQTTPLLLREAQLALQRSNELLEQRVAERTEALAESEMKYRALFENSLHMVFLTRTDGAIADANPAACQALGMTREEICARGRAGIVLADRKLEEGLNRRAADSKARGELTYIRQDGSTFLAEVDSVIVNPEWKDWTTFVTARDITERRQAEAERERLLKEVQRQKDLFEQLIQHSPIGIAVLQGPEHRFVLANRAQNNLFPIIPDFTGQTVAEAWPNQSELFILNQTRVFQTGEPYHAIDAPWKTDKGQGLEQAFYTSATPQFINRMG